MWFNKLEMRWKIAVIMGAIFFPIWIASVSYFFYETYWLQVKTQLGGLMNFADAKQQGVIRFLGQNKKMANSLGELSRSAGDDVLRKHFKSVIATDTFALDDHPFKTEINGGKRQIPTWQVYHSIDVVKEGVIQVSSSPLREGRAWGTTVDPRRGYSDVYRDLISLKNEPVITFASPAHDGRTVYVNADARMLTLIVNGEIGNMEKGMGTFYLAGVGKTFDFYMVDRSNRLITESRAIHNGMLTKQGSETPWKTTMADTALGIVCGKDGTYTTNAKCTTGCREAMGFYKGVNGKDKLGASMPFYDSEWTLVVEQDADELLTPLYRLYLYMALAAVGAGAIVFLLFVLAINRYVFRPVKFAKPVFKT